MMFRDLRADEIDVRVSQISADYLILLLYKNARVDMDILDETVGAMNWERMHSRDNKNCTVMIWDNEKSQWVAKEDTGKESNTEKEKGLASDSFKRACFNWGIGRELYTAPFIYIPLTDKLNSFNYNRREKNGKYTCSDHFVVEKIKIENKVITGLSIYNLSLKKRVFVYAKVDNKQEKQD